MSQAKTSKKFSSLLPPPNLTGILHLGHVWNATIQDFIIRWNKLLNKQIYWPLGLDHAGLSLQIRFEKEIKEQGIDINSLSQEKYKEEILNWKNQNASSIKEQFNSMNFSINYEDEVYTMDDFSEKYSLKIFKQLFEEGLIYQSETLINWDTGLKTAISDSEVSYQEKTINLYYLKYFFENSDEQEFIEVATTRPETIFGDVAIFVNPKDERYKKHLNKNVLIPFINKPIPILSDPSIEIDFGTGCMKCSPAHDFLDWELHKKHNLKIIKSFNIDGIISNGAKDLSGLHKDDAKKKLIKHLEDIDAVRIEQYKTNVAYSERSGSIIEPSISKQWFLSSSKLTKNLINHISNKSWNINFYPRKYEEITKTTLENMHDWCISRQIKWGIQFPIFINKKNKDVVCSLEPMDSDEYEQIPDRLDTWFTSSLWSLIVFNDERKKDSGFYFPIDLLVSGRDILLFWITKMIFMCWHIKREIPFKTILLHGLILDKNGKKMSKSLGNGVTPQELLNKYGSDVIKLFLLLNTFGDDNIKYLEDKLDAPNRFIQKLKNAFYFFKNKELLIKSTDYKEDLLLWYEQEIWNRFVSLKKDLINCVNNYDFSNYSNKLMDFLWDDFCNLFLEIVKEDNNKQKGLKDNSKKFISFMWEQILLLLSPVVPSFANEKIKEIFENNLENHSFNFSEKDNQFIKTPNRDWFFKHIKISRQIYHALEIDNKTSYSISIIVPEQQLEKFKQENYDVFEYFSLLKQNVSNISSKKSKEKSVCFTVDNLIDSDKKQNNLQNSIDVEIFLNDDLIKKYEDFVNKQIKKYTFEVQRSEKILSNKAFVEKAENSVVQKETQKKEEYIQKLNFYKNIIYG